MNFCCDCPQSEIHNPQHNLYSHTEKYTDMHLVLKMMEYENIKSYSLYKSILHSFYYKI